jgi:hypothetical protein
VSLGQPPSIAATLNAPAAINPANPIPAGLGIPFARLLFE